MIRFIWLLLFFPGMVLSQTKYFLPVPIESSNGRPIKDALVELYRDDAVVDTALWLDAGRYYYTDTTVVTSGVYDIYVQGIQWQTNTWIGLTKSVNASQLRGLKITQVPPSDNQILKWNTAQDSLMFEADSGGVDAVRDTVVQVLSDSGVAYKIELRDTIVQVFSDSSVTKLGSSIGPNEMTDGAYGDFAMSGGIASLSADCVGPDEINNGDYGDFTFSSGSASLDANTVDANEIASTAVTPGSYTNTDLTVDADGRITAASNGSAVEDSSFVVLQADTLDANNNSDILITESVVVDSPATFNGNITLYGVRLVLSGAGAGIDSVGYIECDSLKIGAGTTIILGKVVSDTLWFHTTSTDSFYCPKGN